MNKKQKISLIGFFIGLAMIASLNIYNKFTMYIVMLGFIVSLSCALAYSVFQYIPAAKEKAEYAGLVQLTSEYVKEWDNKNWRVDKEQEEPEYGYIMLASKGTSRQKLYSIRDWE